MTAARATPGCERADARCVAGVHHTLTIWRDPEALRHFLTSAAHQRAVHAFPKLGMGRTLSYRAMTQPSWPEALEKWRREARDYTAP